MTVVCDTCALLMLLRIAPAMFEDNRYGCVTIHNVWEEFTQNARLGRDYAWRSTLRKHVRSIPRGELETAGFQRRLKAVNVAVASQKNESTGRPFNLSWADRRIAATCLDRRWELCTAEYGLEEFMQQQFNRENVCPLRLVNNWLKLGLIVWDDSRQAVIAEWIANHERPQPQSEIKRFEKLTGREYPA